MVEANGSDYRTSTRLKSRPRIAMINARKYYKVPKLLEFKGNRKEESQEELRVHQDVNWVKFSGRGTFLRWDKGPPTFRTVETTVFPRR